MIAVILVGDPFSLGNIGVHGLPEVTEVGGANLVDAHTSITDIGIRGGASGICHRSSRCGGIRACKNVESDHNPGYAFSAEIRAYGRLNSVHLANQICGSHRADGDRADIPPF
ncbi:MAG: hypothetical protein DIKNOCCD_01149 [bacterium]|nr:hypothetical protein [bacterium]